MLLLLPTVVEAKLLLVPSVTYRLLGGNFNWILVGTDHVGLVSGKEAAVCLLTSVWEGYLCKCWCRPIFGSWK